MGFVNIATAHGRRRAGKPANAGFQLLTLAAVVINLLLITSAHGQYLYEGDSCNLSDGSTGVCTASTDCAWFNETVIKNKQFNLRVNCGFRGKVEIICCKSSLEIGLRAKQACEYTPEIHRLTFHIINGVEAEEGEFPFVAALGYENVDDGPPIAYRCGASLISENFLITAAHCIPKEDRPVVALLGTTILASEKYPGVQVRLKEFYPHPDYRSSRRYNDIALIELERRLENEHDISPICLHTDTDDLPEDVVLSAEGFGITNVSMQLTSTVLMKVNLTTVALDKCNQTYADNNLLEHNRRLPQGLIETQYCVVGQKNSVSKEIGDTCQGDSGGPLQVKENDKFKLVGVTSFGNGCGTNTPSVYTRIARYLDWIERVVWP